MTNPTNIVRLSNITVINRASKLQILFLCMQICFLQYYVRSESLHQRENILKACITFCQRIETGGFMEFCHCRTMITTTKILPMLETFGIRSVVGVAVWPIDDKTCQVVCISLINCQFPLYDNDRKECIFGQFDRKQFISTYSTSTPNTLSESKSISTTDTTVSRLSHPFHPSTSNSYTTASEQSLPSSSVISTKNTLQPPVSIRDAPISNQPLPGSPYTFNNSNMLVTNNMSSLEPNLPTSQSTKARNKTLSPSSQSLSSTLAANTSSQKKENATPERNSVSTAMYDHRYNTRFDQKDRSHMITASMKPNILTSPKSECSLYSNLFIYKKETCAGLFKLIYKKISAFECRQKCVKLEGQKCRGYHVRQGDCYLLTQADLHVSNSAKPSIHCRFFPRLCRTCDKYCVPPNYVCKKGRCICNMLYSTTEDGRCLPGCNSYTDEFTLQTSGNSTCLRKMDNQYKVASLEQCQEKCLREEFRCAFFEMKKGICYTSRWRDGYVESKHLVVHNDCRHFTRHCDHAGGECMARCKEPNYVCQKGKCVCNMGYSETRDGKCVKGCRTFSNSFTLQTFGCFLKYEEKYPKHTKSQCKSACLRIRCGSYEIDDGMCYVTMWKEKYFHQSYWPDDRCDHYTRNCRDKGGKCDACNPPNYRCRHEKCICQRGYSYVKLVGTCNEECVSYADTFTQQSRHYCIHDYQKMYRSTGTDECKRLCRQEKDFVCGAFHIYRGSCYLMAWAVDWLEKKWHYYQGCIHYMRDCKPNCERGYSLIRQKNKCVYECKEYTNEFQKQSMTTCKEKTLKYRNVDKRQCEKLCLRSKHVCDGYELHHGNCHIVRTDIKLGDWKSYRKCIHFQRICKS